LCQRLMYEVVHYTMKAEAENRTPRASHVGGEYFSSILPTAWRDRFPIFLPSRCGEGPEIGTLKYPCNRDRTLPIVSSGRRGATAVTLPYGWWAESAWWGLQRVRSLLPVADRRSTSPLPSPRGEWESREASRE
jgi:hypothetical protein